MTALVRKHASGGAISGEREHGGVGFFHAAAVIAATEERGTMPEWQIKDASGDGCGGGGKNSHFWSRFVVLDLLALSAE